MVHALEGCPDAPFVVATGGDNASNNFHITDVREAAAVRSRFGSRKLANPLGFSEFGYKTADEAEPEAQNGEEMEEDASEALESMAISKAGPAENVGSGGGAAGKFKKKDKKKKKKKQF